MKRVVIAVMALLVLFSFGCKETKEEKIETKEVMFTKEGDLTLSKANNDSIVASLDVEFAQTEYETQTGLMYRKSMQDNHCMLFIFEDETPRSFYMKNTEFSIDIIFANANKEIVSIHKSAQPYDKTSLPSGAAAKYVLEVNAGLSDQWGLETGDKLNWNKN